MSGLNAGSSMLSTNTLVIVGEIDTSGQIDVYRFQLSAGRFITAELISLVDNNILSFDSQLTLAREEAMGPDTVLYNNDDEFESFDSILLDFAIATDGAYKIIVQASNSGPEQMGSYKLLVYVYDAPMIQVDSGPSPIPSASPSQTPSVMPSAPPSQAPSVMPSAHPSAKKTKSSKSKKTKSSKSKNSKSPNETKSPTK